MWYAEVMSGTFSVVMGDRGRLVIPSEVRGPRGLSSGQPLLLLDADDGLLILTREQAKSRFRASLSTNRLADELIADRRDEVKAESQND
jgi:AbrB family looped-hinge helix DNA binding protein